MLPLRAMDDDDAWMTEGVAPLVGVVTTLALRMLRELVVRSSAVIPAVHEDPGPTPDAEVQEIVVVRGIEVRSPMRLLAWHRRLEGPPASERPRRA